MSYAFTRDVPVDEHHYAEVRAAIGAAAPEGLVVHLVVRRDGGLRSIDVWDSEAHWRRFHDKRIGPAVRTVAAAHGMTRPATPPPDKPMELIDAWVPDRRPREPGRDAATAGSAPRLAGIHHLKVHVTDVRRSALWYQRVLGYRPVMEFAEADRLVGYGLDHPGGGTFLTLRLDPDHAAQTAGRVYFETGTPDKAALDELARRLDDLGEPHGPVRRTPAGWVLRDLYDPDGHEVRFYVTGVGAPTADRPARMHDAGPVPGSSRSTARTRPPTPEHRHTLPPAKTTTAVASSRGASPMPSQTLPADAGRPEPGTERTPIPPTTCSVEEPDCGGNSAEAAARQRIAQARAWQWWAELRGDLCEHRSATAAVQRACDELTQVSTIAPATGHVTVAVENRP